MGTRRTSAFRKWAGADDEPNDNYRLAFVWYDAAEKNLFKSCKLQIADVIDGRLHAVPHGVIAAGNVNAGVAWGCGSAPGRHRESQESPRSLLQKLGDEAPWERD